MKRQRLLDPGLSYLSAGDPDAPLVVCLHGFPDIPRTWSSLMRALASEGYHIVAPWLRGYAPSTIEGPFDQRQLADDLRALIDHLSPNQKVHVVGHDWGAAIVYEAVSAFPDRICSMTTLAVPHLSVLPGNIVRAPMQLRRSWYIGFVQLRGVADAWWKRADYRFIDRIWRDWSPSYVPDEDYQRELKQCFRASGSAPLEYYRAFARRDERRRFIERWFSAPLQIDVPALYIHGREDGCIGEDMTSGQSRHYAAQFEMVTVPDAGHFVHLEKPERVDPCITDWIKRQQAAAVVCGTTCRPTGSDSSP